MIQLTTHQKNIVLKGIANGASLRNRHPEIKDDTIICKGRLSIWDICSISSDAEAFNMKATFHYQDGVTIIKFEYNG